MTRKVLAKLPEGVRQEVERLRRVYSAWGDGARRSGQRRDETRIEMSAYARGLRDGGLLTDRERQVLFCYMTTPVLKGGMVV